MSLAAILLPNTNYNPLAIHIQTLKTRTLTAIVFALVMLSGLLLNGYLFISLFAIVLLGALHELSKIAKLIAGQRYYYFIPLALIYIILPLMLLVDLGMQGHFYLHHSNELQHGIEAYSPILPCVIIFSIWINDTMAYLVGSVIGKTPFSPISPKKTWEGTIGGIVLSVAIIGWLCSNLVFLQSIHWIHWVLIATIASITGTVGDLFESKLKRLANIKDSGHFMPGHGGFLDRFDSLLLATPFVWLYVQLFL
jgi:phosphatidate cytidylyltransferase